MMINKEPEKLENQSQSDSGFFQTDDLGLVGKKMGQLTLTQDASKQLEQLQMS